MSDNRTYLFVRHAHAAHQRGALRKVAPSADGPLTARGARQARRAARMLAAQGIERVVSSELRRARETAAHIADAAGLPYEHAWPQLDEIAPRLLHAGGSVARPEWWDGLLGAWRLRKQARGASPRSLALASVERRVSDVLRELDRLPERRVAVVGHGYWILLMSLTLPGPLRPRWVANCSVTRVEADGWGGHRLIAFARPLDAARVVTPSEPVA